MHFIVVEVLYRKERNGYVVSSRRVAMSSLMWSRVGGRNATALGLVRIDLFLTQISIYAQMYLL